MARKKKSVRGHGCSFHQADQKEMSLCRERRPLRQPASTLRCEINPAKEAVK